MAWPIAFPVDVELRAKAPSTRPTIAVSHTAVWFGMKGLPMILEKDSIHMRVAQLIVDGIGGFPICIQGGELIAMDSRFNRWVGHGDPPTRISGDRAVELWEMYEQTTTQYSARESKFRATQNEQDLADLLRTMTEITARLKNEMAITA